MKKDPSPRPLNLAKTPKGGWVYVQPETGFNINGKNNAWSRHSFWYLAQRLARHRKGNKLDRADFESAQRDILISTRNSMGLPDGSEEIQKSNIQQFLTERKVKGCGGCGKKRKSKATKIGYL